MNTRGYFQKRIFAFVISLAILFSVSSTTALAIPDTVTMSDSTITFNHFAYTLNGDKSIASTNPASVVGTVFNTKVIENGYLKVTLLPDYGGRIISIIYKPTGHELLYQNPVGTPYGIGEGNFYYNWLMVYGGIMPTLSEPEHGKYWLSQWSYQVVSQSSDKISIQMSMTDNTNFTGTPGKFNNGATGINCKATYTVYAGKPYVEMKVNLKNNQNQAVNYEYWTCNTLAPGSQPGNTIGSTTMEIVAPMTQVKNKDDWWPWMGTVDQAVDAANHIFKFDNLAHFSNWADMGIAYANNLSGNWWGVLNHENEEGILRIADNTNATPGMKLWTWGYNQSYNTNPLTYGNSARPYIELWGGNSSEFFADATLQPLQEKEWTEYYVPTVGLSQVTNANQNGAAYLNYTTNSTQAIFNAKVNTTLPGQTVNANLSLVGSTNYTLLNQSIVGDASNAATLTVTKALNTIAAGSYSYQLVLTDTSGNVLLNATIPFEGSQASVAAPTFSPNGGNYTSSQTVTMSCATSGATIRYTTDGTVPTAASTLYSAPIVVAETATLIAKAFKTGMTDSPATSATYTIGNGDLSSRTWYLFNQATSGVTPAGQNLQTSNSGTNGWQPLKTINTTPGYWYSPLLSGTHSAGTWTFTLWTNSPSSASNVTVELYKVNADGSSATLLGSQTRDVFASGTGNHPTQFTYNLSSVGLTSQKLMIKIVKASGADATMCYNTNDFPTRLVTP